jgi:hypothetical protein
MLVNPDYVSALVGGLLIGLSATIYWFVLGRVFGISGVLRSTFKSAVGAFRKGALEEGMANDSDEVRLWLILGLLLGGLVTPLMSTGFDVYAPVPSQHFGL